MFSKATVTGHSVKRTKTRTIIKIHLHFLTSCGHVYKTALFPCFHILGEVGLLDKLTNHLRSIYLRGTCCTPPDTWQASIGKVRLLSLKKWQGIWEKPDSRFWTGGWLVGENNNNNALNIHNAKCRRTHGWLCDNKRAGWIIIIYNYFNSLVVNSSNI